MFDASEFAAHPMYSVAQGGLDLQQVTGIRASFLLTPFFFFWSFILDLRSECEGSRRRELASQSRVCVACPNLLIWHEALEREQLSVKLQLLFSPVIRAISPLETWRRCCSGGSTVSFLVLPHSAPEANQLRQYPSKDGVWQILTNRQETERVGEGEEALKANCYWG